MNSPRSHQPNIAHRARILICLGLIAAAPLAAIEPPDGSSPAAEKAFRNPDLRIVAAHRAPAELAQADSVKALQELASLGIQRPEGARLDLRGGRWATLMPSERLLPDAASGGGTGRQAAAGPPTRQQAWQALTGYLEARRAQLRIDPAELASPGRVAIHGGGELIQIHAPRVFRGVPVRGSYLTAVINHGNLVLFGAVNWGDIEVSTRATLADDQALGRVQRHVDPLTIAGTRGKSQLVLVPLANGADAARVVPGSGYSHRLAWVVRPEFADDLASWEALVDAHSGELLAFEDTNHYATSREVKGGVYPVSNDGIVPDGVEQAGWPMPFEELANAGGPITTDSGGNAYCADGNVTANMSGPFVNMFDNCGAASLTGTNVDWGTSGGDDCTTPGFGGAGNTHSSRTGFHEINRLIEQAKGHLPDNGWLYQQLTSNMNINQNCNAFWNGSTINFYRSGGGCANTGEIAGVFDHEWGHGIDANDVGPFSSPGEGIADLYAYHRLNDSCIGRGFRPGVNCSGFGDACLNCTGVREIDWAKRASGAPHDVLWADGACGSGGSTPCGGSTHCEGQVYAEAVYDLVNRDLPTKFSMNSNTAFEVGTRLTYLGAGPVGSWFTCNYIDPPPIPPVIIDPYNGCNADGGYLNYLAADDDNGNLADGTPHMSAIFAAFDRHGIACDTPTVTDSGCVATPTAAPAVTATALDRGVALSWGAVTGASKYQVFRTDGVFACDFGKIKVGETTGTSFLDEGLQNGRPYSYLVIPIGAGDTCMGPASSCDTATPATGVNLLVDESTAALVINSGDGDDFLDNCETATASFDVLNIGNAAQTDVRIDDVRPISHPGITIDSINAVSPSGLAVCTSGTGSFDFTAEGLAHGDTVTFEVDVTSDELSPVVKTRTLVVAYNAESDLQAVASQTWDFESDLDGWTLVQGTFNQTTTGGGASGSAGYVASSAFLDDQCDQVLSPALQLTAASTLSAFTNYDIEAFSSGQWWDRANVAVLDGAARTAVSPDSGRTYNASGAGASCVTAGQPGWADVAGSWASSGWSAAALGSAGFAGKSVHLDVAYGTDGAANGKGFWFDKVTLTDFELLVPDAQADVCNTPPDVTITAPAEGAEFVVTDSIGFTGTATDVEDIDLAPSLSWSSDIDGAIGTTGSFSTTLSAGYHTVTASVTDSGGLPDSDTVHVAVASPPTCLQNVVVDNQTVMGTTTFSAVQSVTVGATTTFDGTSDVTVEAGERIAFAEVVKILGTAAFRITPTPCP
jgi:hypothetical protein